MQLITPGSVQFNDGTVQTTSATGPAYRATSDTNLSGISELTAYKLPINVELSAAYGYDSGNYNTSTYRFTPTKAGYYYVSAIARLNPGSSHSGYFSASIGIYKNGTEYLRIKEVVGLDNNAVQMHGSVLIDFNGSTDYIEIYGGWDSYGSSAAGALAWESFAAGSQSTAFFVRPL